MTERHSQMGVNWTDLAAELGISKQNLTAFRKRRTPVLDAESLLRLCSLWKVELVFEGVRIAHGRPNDRDEPRDVQLIMEFDESFEISADRRARAIMRRKPPNRALVVGFRVEEVAGAG